MAQKQETLITNKILKWIKDNNGDGFHVHGSMFQRKGEPDIDGWIYYGGRFWHLKLEVKTAVGKPDDLQIHRLKIYSRAGYIAGIVRSVEDLEALLHHHVRWENRKIIHGVAAGSFSEFMERSYEDHFNIYSSSGYWQEQP
jgi:hypothetical protein